MIVVACTDCKAAIRIMPLRITDVVATEELESLVGSGSEFWPDKYPCPRCERLTTAVLEREVAADVIDNVRITDLTPLEAYAAFHGIGLPEEQKCSLKIVEELFQSIPVKKIIGMDVIGAERAIIDAFELVDGTRIYLGAGGDGAVVYRIARKPSYTKLALGEVADADHTFIPA